MAKNKKAGPEGRELHFVANMRSIEQGGESSTAIEYEVTADAHVVGECKYGPYSLNIWEFGIMRPGQNRRLCLRVEEARPQTDFPIPQSPDNGALYHGGGIASEIVAVASVALRCRCTLGAVTRLGDQPMMLPTKNVDWIDRQAIYGTKDLSALPQWLKLIANLTATSRAKFLLSAKLYQQGLELIESKPDLAYLNLISAVEVLSQDYEVQRTIRDQDEDLADLLDQIGDSGIRQKIERRLVERHISFIGYRFRRFILAHTEDTFWHHPVLNPGHGESEPAQTSLWVTPDTLEVWLKRIYTQRSRTLHAGEAFPPTTFIPLLENYGAEFPPEFQSQGRAWKEKDVIPHPQFFERLVNHVLKNFVIKNQKDVSVPDANNAQRGEP